MTDSKLTIREGGFYRTRDGRRVGPMAPGRDAGKTGYPWTEADRNRRGRWSDEGEDGEASAGVKICGGDLIAEWTDAAPTPATDAATIQRVMEASAPAADDPVMHPAHYTSHPSGVECLTITRWMGFNLGNAVKYIWRADMKGAAIEDLRKAAFYIADEIAKREATNGVIDPASYRVEARG